MSVRIRYNWDFIRGLLTAPETQDALLNVARAVDRRATGQGSQTRIDSQDGPRRARAAVIAGYEDGASAENTRRILLRSLEGGHDA